MISMDIETLRTVKGLDIPATINTSEAAKLCAKMDEFVSVLPQNTYKWTRSFSIRDYDYLANQFIDFSTLLNSIYAVSLSNSCIRLVRGFTKLERSHLDVLMQRFTTELLTLSINIQTANYSPSAADKKPAERSSKISDGGKKTILAVDDMPLLLKALKAIIEDEQYIFHGLNSGKSALNYLQKHEPDIFILDIEMPEMDGYELLKKIRDMGQVAPVIFLTGNTTREYVLKAIKLGADGFLAKPVEKDLVREKLKELLG